MSLMTPSLDAIDAQSEEVRKGFRITLADLKARVADVEYIERNVLNIAVLTLDNGYYLVGMSAPVDPANYNAEYGRQLAYEDALRQGVAAGRVRSPGVVVTAVRAFLHALICRGCRPSYSRWSDRVARVDRLLDGRR